MYAQLWQSVSVRESLENTKESWAEKRRGALACGTRAAPRCINRAIHCNTLGLWFKKVSHASDMLSIYAQQCTWYNQVDAKLKWIVISSNLEPIAISCHVHYATKQRCVWQFRCLFANRISFILCELPTAETHDEMWPCDLTCSSQLHGNHFCKVYKILIQMTLFASPQ